MDSIEKRQYIRQCAMQHGLWFAAYIVVQFLLTVNGLHSVWCSALSLVLLLLAPVFLFVLWLTVRSDLQPEPMSFGLSFLLVVYIVFFTTLLFVPLQIAYFKYLNPEFIGEMTRQAIESLGQLHTLNPTAGYDELATQLRLQAPTGVEIGFSSAWLLIFAGVLWGLLVAAAGRFLEHVKSSK